MTEELLRNNMQRSRMLVEGSLSYDGLGEHHEWTSASDLLNGTWSLMTQNTRRNMIGIVADWKASASVMYSEAL